jgi:hypothetical protein
MRPRSPHNDVDQGRNGQDEQQVQHNKPPLFEYTRVGRLSAVTDKQTGGATGRVVRDVVIYTLARLLLVIALTAVIFYGAQLFGIREFPLVIAMLFGIVLALPLGFWLLAPLRRRATAGIADIDERRRTDRDDLQARLRGEQD